MRTRGFHAAAIAAAALALAFAHIDATAQTALWSRTLQGTATKVNAVARSAAADAYGYVVVTGSAQNGTSPDAFAVRFNAANGQVAWVRAIDNGLPIGGYPVDEWFGAVTDAGGNAIVLARSQPMVRKLAASSGAFLWSTALTGTLVASAVDGSGNVFVAATAWGGGGADIALHKLDAVSGQLVWSRTFDGPAGLNDEAVAVAVDGSGNAIVVGNVSTASAGTDIQVLKYSGTGGTLLWSHRYDGPAHWDDSAKAVALDPGGNVVVAGATEVDGPRFTAFKLSGDDGHSLWTHIVPKVEPGGYDTASAIAIATNGDPVVGGQYTAGADWGARTLRLAGASGSVVWEVLEGPSPPVVSYGLRALALDAADNVLVALDRDDYTSVAAVKYAAATGERVWMHVEQGGPLVPRNRAVAILRTSLGDPVLVADVEVDSRNPATHDFLVARLSGESGALVWKVGAPIAPIPMSAAFGTDCLSPCGLWRFEAPNKRALTPGAGGSAFAAGSAWNGRDWDAFVGKVDAASGVPAWLRQIDGPGETDDRIAAVAADPGADVFVAGIGGTSGGNDVLIARLSGATGADVWRRTAGTAPVDNPVLLARDAAGDVVVASTAHLAKYAGTTGNVIWSRSFTGARAMTLDAGGNVYVTGVVDGWTTQKYSGASGSPAWSASVGGGGFPTAGIGYVAIALDAAGDVVATGNGEYGPLLYHYVWTLKLGGADGTLRWLQRYLSTPFGTEDYASAVAVDGVGDVVVVGYGYEGARVAHAQKYAGTNGALLWAGAGSSWSYEAVATDPWGNPLVAGSVGVSKLVGSDGLTVWNANFSPLGAIALLPGGALAAGTVQNPGALPGLGITRIDNPHPAYAGLALSASPEPSVFQGPLSLWGSLVPVSRSGWVAFAGPGGAPLCAVVPMLNGIVNCDASAAGLPPGRWALTATWSGNSAYAPAVATIVHGVQVAGALCDGFADLAATDPFCANATWLANRSITLGCASGWYCPYESTGRLAMAAFMNRLGGALGPRVVEATAAVGALDPDTAPPVCVSADEPAVDYPRAARVDAVLAVGAANATAIEATIVASSDGGATWQPLAGVPLRAGVAGNGYANVRLLGRRDLAAGEVARFGVVVRRGGADSHDLTLARCHLRTVIGNADP
jgi:hypothetical protein